MFLAYVSGYICILVLLYSAAVYIRAVAAYLKVVRRRKPSSAEGTRERAHERGIIPLPLVGGGSRTSPRENF